MKRSEFYIPLSERMRPLDIDDVLGQEHILGPDTVFGKAIREGRVFSVILWGPPGTGKTTIARIIADKTKLPFHKFSAVTSGLKELREIIQQAKRAKELFNSSSILFVDEIHRFNKAQQDAFLPYVESGLIVLIGATTQNPSFEVIPPLLSRTKVLTLNPLGKKELILILKRAMSDETRGLGKYKLRVEESALEHIALISHGDARFALDNLEAVFHHMKHKGTITLEDVKKATFKSLLPYDKDGEEHYNLISAFHKSIRGGDVQASLYWLYRMLEAGEDPLFIARRLIRCAVEDIGLADPSALQVANSAFDAWEKVGPPEAELALAEAVIYLATAPKSNSLYLAEKEVKRVIKETGPLPVPLHIRNAPTKLMESLGYGKGYLYPHNYKDAWVNQEYLPNRLKGHIFYRPTDRGYEKNIKEFLKRVEKNKSENNKR